MFPSFFHSIFLSGVNVIDSFMHLSPVVHISTQGQMQLCTAHFHFDSHVIQKGLSAFLASLIFLQSIFPCPVNQSGSLGIIQPFLNFHLFVLAVSFSMWGLSSATSDRTRALGAQSVNHCTIRVVPISIFKLVICSPNIELLLGTRNCGARLMSYSHREALLKTLKPMGILGKGCPLAEIWKVLQTFKVGLNILPDVFPKCVTWNTNFMGC